MVQETRQYSGVYIMSNHFEEAFLSSSSTIPEIDEIFDFDAASGRPLGNGARPNLPRRASIEDAEFSDVLSDNDDGLFCDTSDSGGHSHARETAEEEDMATTGDEVYSWKIDHSSGDHKLRRR
jgi:hypothetical protein